MEIYQRLAELNVELPPLPPKGGIYKPVKQVKDLIYISGQGPTINGIPQYKGKLGREIDIETGQKAALLCVLNALSNIENYLGDLAKVKGLVKMLGFVASSDGFTEQPKVIDGASRFLQDLMGENGVGARSAIAANELPGGIPVEIEFIFELF